LIFNDQCKGNLAVYLHKQEVKKAKKVGIVGNIATLRSIVQLVSENQLWNLELTIMTISAQGNLVVFDGVPQLEKYVQENFPEFSAEDTEQLQKIEAMSREERWAFWTEQMSACIKCYACRAVCPMCYCSQCTVECNQPQWIKLSSTTVGNIEWHTMRAMHLAGRCINCGECGRMCPAGIPVHLLTAKMNKEVEKDFGGTRTGFSASQNYQLNTFKPDDKEGFIK
jgi:ferredoxin